MHARFWPTAAPVDSLTVGLHPAYSEFSEDWARCSQLSQTKKLVIYWPNGFFGRYLIS